MASNPYAGFLPKRETLCLTRAANLQKILRHEEREEREKGGEGKENRDERKEGEGMEEKKDGEVRAMKTEGKKLTWSSKTMRRQKKRGHWDMEYQRQKRI